MWHEPTKERLSLIPKLYSCEKENTFMHDIIIYLHFNILDCHWYVAEFDGKDTFWGYVILHGDILNSEWGFGGVFIISSNCLLVRPNFFRIYSLSFFNSFS